jgi:dihydrofolate reductase
VARVAADISMSLDGFIAGANDGPDNGLGDGGDQLHQWVYGLKSWREPHGLEGGETGPDADVLEEAFAAAGAVVVGKRMFDNAGGWGDNPPFHMPVFVLTHEDRADEAKEGGTTFTFVSGIEDVIRRAQDAAGDKDVSIGGGASVIQQAIRAGLLDEIQIHLVPLLLGDGIRLFEGVDGRLEPIRLIESPDVTHVKFRVLSS